MVNSMFMGEYSHTIDTKGRVIVPARFRDALGTEFVVTLGLDGCLFLYTMEEWKSFSEKLEALPGGKEVRQLKRFFMAGAFSCELDKQGRMLIPQKHREHAALEKEIFFVGMSNKIEIWSKERYEALSFDGMDDVADKLSDLGISF